MNRKEPLPDFIADALAVDRDMASDRRELDSVLAAVAASVGVEVPPVGLKDRLLAAATTGPARFAPFFDDLERLFDLDNASVVRMLERAGLESEWEAGPHPSIRVFHLQPGPALRAADAGLVRISAGFERPAHRHSAAEKVLILEGGYTDSSGRVYEPGDLHEEGPGSEHSFIVLPDSPLLFALVLHGPIETL